MTTETYINLVIQVALEVKNPPASAREVRDIGLIPGLGRSRGGGSGLGIPWTEEHGELQPIRHKEVDTTEQYTKICMKL